MTYKTTFLYCDFYNDSNKVNFFKVQKSTGPKQSNNHLLPVSLVCMYSN